ncbi:DICT sensory domain-containing protein, partial [Leptolyngbya sp. FACHB-36]|uniref:DICT sensory domain-containing protein n=1 Tax=Leptolyngbya sp. FACHB-36 TaxID=2692808 RepID=UPI002410CB96
MNTSLVELALSAEPSPPVVQLSAVTFKSLVSTLIDVLIEQQIDAVLWVKLPRGEAWQIELDRYRSFADIAKTLYVFKNQREESVDDVAASRLSLSTLDGDRGASAASDVITLSLPLDNPIRREYFLLVWSASFQGGILAQRVRTADSGADDNQDKRQSLMTLSVFEADRVQLLINGLEQVLSAPRVQSGLEVSIADPIAHWQHRIVDLLAESSNLSLLEHLFSKQLQKQEDIWQRSSLYRKQAEVAESLQVQNEELVNAVRSKDEFLSNVGQELRTPLTTIKTALTLLNSSSLKPPQRQRYMELIAKECDRQSSLIT